MKYCMNCGTGLEDDEAYCSECGMKQDYEPDSSEGSTEYDGQTDAKTDSKKPFFRKPAGIAVIAAAVLITAGVIVFACIMNNPKVILANAIKNTAEDIQKIPAMEFMSSVGEQGSVSVAVNLEDLIKNYGIDMDGELVCTEYFDASKYSTAVITDLKLHNSSAIDAGVWVSPDAAILNSKVLFGKNAYGIGFKSLKDNLKKSDYADMIPDDVYDSLNDADSAIFEDPEKCAEVIAEYFSGVSEYFGKQLIEGAEFDKSSDDIDFAESTVKAKVITMTVDEDCMHSALKSTLKYAEKEGQYADARKLIENYIEITNVAAGNNVNGEYLMEIIFEKLEDNVDRLDGMELEARFYIYKSRLVKAEFEELGTDRELSIIFGPDPADPELCEIAFVGNYADYSAGLEVETNTSSEYEARLYASYLGEVEDMDISWDKKNGDLSVKIKDLLSVSGTMKSTKDELAVEIDKIKVYGDKQNVDISMLVRTKDDMPPAPKYKDVLKMNEDEIEDLMRDVEDSIGELLYQW